jgi:hypothetical protein
MLGAVMCQAGVIISQLAEEGRLAELGAVVVDELRTRHHSVADDCNQNS